MLVYATDNRKFRRSGVKYYTENFEREDSVSERRRDVSRQSLVGIRFCNELAGEDYRRNEDKLTLCLVDNGCPAFSPLVLDFSASRTAVS
jgi:hypothetical protein